MYMKILKLGKLGRFKAILNILLNLLENIIILLFGVSLVLLIDNNYYIFIYTTLALIVCMLILLFIDNNSIIYWSEKSIQYITNKYVQSLFRNSKWGANSKSLVEVISGDISSIRKLSVFYEEIIPQFIEMFILYIILFIFSLKNMSMVFLIVPMSLVLMYIVSFFVRKIQLKVNKRRDKRYINMGKKFMEDLKAMPTILNYKADEIFQKNFNIKSENHRKDIILSLGISLPRSAARIFIANFSIVLFSFVVYKFYNKIPLVDLIIMQYLNIQILVSTKKFAYANKQVKMLKPVLNRILKLISVEDISINRLNKINKTIENICLKDASFHYDKNYKILDNINLQFKKGNFYNIVGENGSGKSTIVKLIKGKLKLNDGKLLLNNEDIEQIENNSLPEHISIIEKENFLFNTSIKNNLEYANNKKYDFNQIKYILDEYGLLKFVSEFHKKWDTEIGENGILLSNGQRQQLVIAMHILKDKDVYIFDEATSSVNPENTEIILKALKKLSKEKIIINITHSKKDILYADHIIFIDNANIYQGKHDYLMSNEKYKKLYENLGYSNEKII